MIKGQRKPDNDVAILAVTPDVKTAAKLPNKVLVVQGIINVIFRPLHIVGVQNACGKAVSIFLLSKVA